MGMIFFAVRIPEATASASQVAINTAIEKGLVYLKSSQSSDGSWGSGINPVASTAMAVLAFENAPNSHYGWNSSDIYHRTVQNGLNWLFSQATVKPIDSSKSAGNPDNNTNGIGIGWYGDNQPVYETPMVLMAIIASNAQSNVTTTGPANVTGRTYHDIAQDVVDWIAWAQNSIAADGKYEGGWRYYAQQTFYSDGPVSDNSVSQWPVLGLLTAQQYWNINASSWVQTELMKWTATAQNFTGNSDTNSYYGSFDYAPGVHIYSPAESAAGILELTYCGVGKYDPRIVAAEGYLNRDWNANGSSPGYGFGWNWNMGDLYAMYAVMKACRLTTPNSTYVLNYDSTPGVEWYNGTGQYADSLLAKQGSNGNWTNWANVNDNSYVSHDLSTSWGVLILEFVPVKVLYKLTATVEETVTKNPIANASVLVEGSEYTYSGITGADGKAVFDQVQAGTYSVTSSMTGYQSSTLRNVSVKNDTDITIYLQENQTCSLTVTVYDLETDVSLVGASVLVEGQDTYSGTTGIGGETVFNIMKPGSYQVTASMTGYFQSTPQTVSVTNDTAIRVSLQQSPQPTQPSLSLVLLIAAVASLGIIGSGIFLLMSADRIRRRRKRKFSDEKRTRQKTKG